MADPNEGLRPGPDETLDTLLRDRVQLLQARKGYRTSVDAMALAFFALLDPPVPLRRVVDLGAGSGLVSILLARSRLDLLVDLIELQPGLAARAERNLRLNGVGDRTLVHLHDLGGAWPTLPPAQLVVSNPPYFQTLHRPPPLHPERFAAHCETTASLERFAAAAAMLLAPDGRVCFVYPVEGRRRLLLALHQAGLGHIEDCRLYHREGDAEPIRLLVRAKASMEQVVVKVAPLYLHPTDSLDHTYVPAIETFLETL
jgi:tRNA1Val (adenine37-N6)-methyltransferase